MLTAFTLMSLHIPVSITDILFLISPDSPIKEQTLPFGSLAAILKTTAGPLLSTQAILPCSSLCLPLSPGPGHRLPDPSSKGLKGTQALRSRSYPFSNQSQASSKPDRKPKPTPHTQNLSWTHCLARVNLIRCRITLTDFNELPHPIYPTS